MTIDEINIPQATAFEFQLTAQATGQSYALNDEMLVGRELDCTIRVDAPQIRRYHAKISVSDDGLFLEDLNAKNNTYLNGCRIGNGAWITLGDEINFDGVKFNVEPAKTSPSDASATALKAALKQEQNQATKAGNLPLSNQDVVEATRALEERAKARLQHFKQSEESSLSPNWQKFIAARFPEETAKTPALAPKIKGRASVTPIRPKSTVADDFEESSLSETELDASINAIDDALSEVGATPAVPEKAKETQPESINESTLPSEKVELEVQPEQEQEVEASTETAQEPDIEHIELSSLDKPDIENKHQPATEQVDEVDSPAPATETMADDLPAQPVKTKRVRAVSAGSGPRLLAQTAPIRGKCYQLATTDAKQAWTIGRANNADVQLSEDGIDLIHAHVEQSDQGFKIRTTRTTNGMLINGKFKSEAVLQHGDSIHFGRIEFTFRDDIEQPATPEDKQRSGVNYGAIAGALVVLGALLAALLANQ